MSSGLSCGIIGLPNVGKSTLFSALTAIAAESANYPFCTIEPNRGKIEVYDVRLKVLSDISRSKELIYAPTEFVDIAGIVEGAHKGEGLGNKFLTNIRETDALVHVVRCFDSNDIIHVDASGTVDPVRDVEVIETELCLADLEMCLSAINKQEKLARGNKEAAEIVAVLKKVEKHLNETKPVRSLELTDEEKKLIKIYPFLTQKKMLYVANVSEEDVPEMDNKHVRQLREFAAKEGSHVIPVCAKIEEEISQLPIEERQEFLQDLGLELSGLQRIIKASFDMLDLITYLTTGEVETRAWTIKKGTLAPEAAGKIHTDIQKGFIRAEVIAYDDFVQYKGRLGAKEAGKARAEGKEYVVKDGDVILFLHN